MVNYCPFIFLDSKVCGTQKESIYLSKTSTPRDMELLLVFDKQLTTTFWSIKLEKKRKEYYKEG